jgi:secreted trypsin-like serine protease
VTIRPDQANPISSARRRGVAGLLLALALLALSAVAAGASAAPRPRGDAGSSRVTNPRATASVIGGHDTTVETYPSLVYIEGVQATAGYACTGTVVAPRVVLTAGHCVEDIESSSIVEPQLIGVVSGVSNLERITKANVTQVIQTLAYPGFNPTELNGDAGLLILATPVAATPIKLAGKAEPGLLRAGRNLKIAGWGIDEFDTEHAPSQLHAATVPIDKASNCRQGTILFDPFYEPSGQFCTLDTQNHQVIFCHGDSGGPAIATTSGGTPVEVGIISLNDGICNPSSPAVYTRADQISTWVQRWIDAVEGGGPKPRVVIPEAHLPELTGERAEELSFLTLAEQFGGTFAHGHEQKIECERRAKERVRCVVTWFKGVDDYFGRITVFYAIRHNVVLAGSHYAVHAVNNNCYFHSDHRESCPIRTKQQ